MSKSLMTAVVAFVFAIGAITGCGGDDSASSPDPTVVATTAPVATPTATMTPTAVPQPTSTVEPTTAPSPTVTTEPTVAPSATVAPTATSVPPTATAVPTATATPEPTATVAPSATPVPAPQMQSFSVAAGEDFVVVLETDSISGYRWELEESIDPTVVLLIDESYIGPGSTNPGSQGRQLFSFRGVSNGTTVIKFWYVGPFENPRVPADRALINVRVGSGTAACHGRFDVTAGEEFVIIVESNPSTGYVWQLRTALDTDVVVMVDDLYIAPTSTTAGATGWQQFTFRGVADGATSISLWYIRSFDDPPQPAIRQDYEVVVGTGIPSCDGRYEVAVGDQFDIHLASNRSTGYTWQLRDELEDSLLQLVSESYLAPDAQPPGSPGLQRFRFVGVGAGTTSVRLWYVRPFEDPLVPLNSVRFNVTIAPN